MVWAREHFTLIFISLILPISGSVISVSLFENWRLEHLLGHAIIEILGALIALAILFYIVVSQSTLNLRKSEVIWIGAALASMGLLDLFHAIVPLGNNFVWFHSMATALGGGFFAMVWWCPHLQGVQRNVIFIVILLTLLLAASSAYFPDMVPQMVLQGEFSIIARLLNICGGIGFIVAFIYFYKQYIQEKFRDYYLLAAHCLLFGVAGILFELSALWDAAWWWWHMLRFAAYLVLIMFFLQRVDMQLTSPMRSVRGKIVLLAFGIATFISTFVGGFNYVRITEATTEAALEGLAGETRILALTFKNAYDDMLKDAQIIQRTPPIDGIIRSLRNKGKDDYDGSTTELWRERLETIFMSVMETRPHYTQIRYIGKENQGKELVRVNRELDGFRAVPEGELQNKSHEIYVQAGLSLQQGEHYFSEITLNREHGVVDGFFTPTVRTVVPVFSEDNTMFGVIVINANYPTLLDLVYQKVSPGKSSIIVNQNGDYFQYQYGQEVNIFEFHKHYSKTPPPIIEKMKHMSTKEAFFEEQNGITYFIRLGIDPKKPGRFIGVALQMAQEEFLAKAKATQRETLLLSLLLVSGFVVLAIFLAHRLSEPLHEMTQNIVKQQITPGNLELPVYLQDEIGELARAFANAYGDVQKAEALFRQAMEYSAIGMALVSPKGQWLKVNKAICVILGYSEAELLKMDFQSVTHKDDLYQDLGLVKKMLDKSIESYQLEKRYIHKDGHIIWALLSASLVWNKDGTPKNFIVQIQDITDSKNAAREKETLIEKLQQSNKELDQFAYVASHDLKAPLRVIDNASRWLEEDLKDLDEESKENLALLRGRVVRMEKLLDDLLEYSRIGKKLNDKYEQSVSGKELMENILLLTDLPKGFTIQIDPTIETLQFKRMPLQQILFNLIGNAIKHHNQDQGTIEVKVEEYDEYIDFSISDDGPGIPMEFQERVFTMFQTLKPRDQVEGSGIGLAIAKKQIEHFGGTLLLISEEGKGCTFRFTWPKQQNNLID